MVPSRYVHTLKLVSEDAIVGWKSYLWALQGWGQRTITYVVAELNSSVNNTGGPMKVHVACNTNVIVLLSQPRQLDDMAS